MIKILGISGSHRKNSTSGVYKLVQAVLDNTGVEYEIVSLRGQNISGCIACLGCVKDNVCKVEDDLAPLREEIVEADAYMIGAPNYDTTLNAATHAVLERFFQFRHLKGNLLWGKLAVAVGLGGTSGRFPADDLEKFFLYNFSCSHADPRWWRYSQPSLRSQNKCLHEFLDSRREVEGRGNQAYQGGRRIHAVQALNVKKGFANIIANP